MFENNSKFTRLLSIRRMSPSTTINGCGIMFSCDIQTSKLMKQNMSSNFMIATISKILLLIHELSVLILTKWVETTTPPNSLSHAGCSTSS
jgi:hypothetical protein